MITTGAVRMPREPAVRKLAGRRGDLPEALDVVALVEHQERPALAEAGAGCADGVGQGAVDDGGVDRGVGVLTDHAAAAYDVLELHGAECA